MKYLVSILILIVSFHANAKNLQPFFLADTVSGNQVNDLVPKVVSELKSGNFKILKIYTPYKGSKIIIYSSRNILKAASQTERGAYAAAQRVAITYRDSKTYITYTNPTYMAYAYHLKNKLFETTNKLNNILGNQKAYGAGDGLTEDQLSNYHYTFGMEYFDEPIEIASFSSYKKAIREIYKGFARNDSGVVKLYEIKIPKRKATIFGVAMKGDISKDKGMDDKWIMNVIDYKEIPQTAHLPYEILVLNDSIESLNSRFRIAINFPTLSMTGRNSFLGIMTSPDSIENSYYKLLGIEGEDSDDGGF